LYSEYITKNTINTQWAKIAEKAVCRRIFLTAWHCILIAELTKLHSFRQFFGGFCPLRKKERYRA